MPEPPGAVEPALTSPASAPHSRRALIGVIFASAVVVGVFATLAVWVNRQVLDTNSWTNTSSQLLADPKIEAAVGGVLVNELFSSVDVSTEIKSALPSQLAGLAAPATAGLRALAIQVAPQVLSTATVQNAWRLANRTAQLELLRILNGGSKTVSTTNGVVVLHLHPLLCNSPHSSACRNSWRPCSRSSGRRRRGRPRRRPAEARGDAASFERQHRDPALLAAEDGTEHRQGDQGPRARDARDRLGTVHPGGVAGRRVAKGCGARDRLVLDWHWPDRGARQARHRRRLGRLPGQGAVKQAGGAPGLRDWHKPSLRHRDRAHHLRNGDRDRRLDRSALPGSRAHCAARWRPHCASTHRISTLPPGWPCCSWSSGGRSRRRVSRSRSSASRSCSRWASGLCVKRQRGNSPMRAPAIPRAQSAPGPRRADIRRSWRSRQHARRWQMTANETRA